MKKTFTDFDKIKDYISGKSEPPAKIWHLKMPSGDKYLVYQKTFPLFFGVSRYVSLIMMKDADFPKPIKFGGRNMYDLNDIIKFFENKF
ncbi:MAG: hypothetical protein ACYC97_09740 [Metallibacterium sp.]